MNRNPWEYYKRIDYLLELYARKLAENINEGYAIEVYAPSGMLAGPAGFLKGVSYARERNTAEWLCIQALLDKIRGTGMDGNDGSGIPRLERRPDECIELQETMKAVNAYYRNHKTLEGCPDLSNACVKTLETDMAAGYYMEDQPFTKFQILNNNAEIRLIQERIRTQSNRPRPRVGQSREWAKTRGSLQIGSSVYKGKGIPAPNNRSRHTNRR